VFQKWLQHPVPDAYYDAMVPSPEQYKGIQFPILTITGHYDGDQPGAFTYYRRHMEYGTTEAKQNHFLIIGPWDHAGTRTPRREVGGLKFGEASVLDLNKLHTEWYDWVMKSGKKPEFLKKRVAYYVVGAGAENWKYADSLESISNEKRTLYLGSNGNAASVFQSGALTEKPASGAGADKWTYDPLDTRSGDAEPDDDAAGLTSQRAVLNTYGNGAIYHSEPFSEATEVTGFLKLSVWLAMDVSDTDIEADVYEILPGGESVYLTGETIRARYRESLRQEKLVAPGKTEKYLFDDFMFFSRRIAKGSRLRLLVHCPNTPSVEKNYNSGGVVALETGKDAKTAHVTLVHDAEHQSTLELPVVK
jgi:putative CocE/NonD family hydrolase